MSFDSYEVASKRLGLKKAVLKELFLMSGNRCAFQNCDQVLMNANHDIVGDIVHIEAALPGGLRYRESMTDDERRQSKNLLMLCATHHRIIDGNNSDWSVDRIREMKASHEAMNTGTIDQFGRKIRDVTEGAAWRGAVNLGRCKGVPDLEAYELVSSLMTVEDMARLLASIPVGARSVLAIIINRGVDVQGRLQGHEVAISVATLEQVVECSPEELKKHLIVLEGVGLVILDDDFDGRKTFVAYNSTGDIGWPLFAELKELAAGDATVISRALVDLDFTVFDV